jgi:PAS domain
MCIGTFILGGVMPHTISEKRLVNRLTEYWERLRKDNPLPLMQTFKKDAITDVIENCLILKREKQGEDKITYVYEFVGKGIIAAVGKDVTGERILGHVHAIPGGAIIKQVEQCVASLQPISDEGKFINDKSKVVKYRSCLLPFGATDSTVTHLLVGLSWRAF